MSYNYLLTLFDIAEVFKILIVFFLFYKKHFILKNNKRKYLYIKSIRIFNKYIEHRKTFYRSLPVRLRFKKKKINAVLDPIFYNESITFHCVTENKITKNIPYFTYSNICSKFLSDFELKFKCFSVFHYYTDVLYSFQFKLYFNLLWLDSTSLRIAMCGFKILLFIIKIISKCILFDLVSQ